MSTLSVRFPESLHKRLKEMADKEGVSINQLITLAVSEKVSTLLHRRLFEAEELKKSIVKLLTSCWRKCRIRSRKSSINFRLCI